MTPTRSRRPGDRSRPGGGEPAETEPEGPRSRRRRFLAAGAATAGVAAGAGLVGRLLTERSSVTSAQKSLRIPRPSVTTQALPPGVDLHIPGLAPFVTPNGSFYRVDTALVLPQVDPSSWQLRIHGMVSREITLTFDQLIKRPLIEDYITLCCVSNPVDGPYIGNAKWLGASLAAVLREAGIKAGADQLLCTSVDGFTSGTPVQTVMDGRDALLAVAMNGQPLPVAHGFPARMVVPGLYGYVSATKWVTDIEVTTFAGNYAYWAQRGWSQQAPIKTECRIDVPNGLSGDRGRPHGGRRGGLGPAQGDRGRRGARGPRAMAAGQAGRRPRSGHLAAVGLGLAGHLGRPRARGACHRQDRLHADGRPGAARTQRGHRLPHGLRRQCARSSRPPRFARTRGG